VNMADSLILIANPGSASRKYALYKGGMCRAELHFEFVYQKLVCTFTYKGLQHVLHLDFHHMGEAATHVVDIFKDKGVLSDHEKIERVGLRIVAPSSFFMIDHVIHNDVVSHLEDILPRAPLHIKATLDELHILRKQFVNIPIVGVSDSAFHITKPDYAWNYGISLEDADRFEIKRFGYHGLSAESVVHELKHAEKLPQKLVVCHLGSGASVTAIYDGKSLDNTMGYSPLEGVVMSTRSGNIDPAAVRSLKDACNFSDAEVENYLNNHSGLLGLGGSSDIRELLRREEDGDVKSKLALQTYVYSVQKAVGEMVTVLDGVDVLVFTGTVGERSAPIRERILSSLHYLDFELNKESNKACEAPSKLNVISRLAHSKSVIVVPAQEAAEMARHTIKATHNWG